MSRLIQLVRQFKGKKVAVLGDFVADVFVYGEISRISREAPVLVLNQRETQLVPGGGANAVHNLQTLGAIPLPIGVVGDDPDGRKLVAFFENLGIDTRGIHVEKSWQTPTKTRILAGAVHAQRQQIVRLDAGGPLKRPPKLPARLPACDALLVSDYGYGTVTPEIVSQL